MRIELVFDLNYILLIALMLASKADRPASLALFFKLNPHLAVCSRNHKPRLVLCRYGGMRAPICHCKVNTQPHPFPLQQKRERKNLDAICIHSSMII